MDKCKLGVIAQERLNIEVKLLFSANSKSHMLRRLGQRMTLNGIIRITRYRCSIDKLLIPAAWFLKACIQELHCMFILTLHQKLNHQNLNLA